MPRLLMAAVHTFWAFRTKTRHAASLPVIWDVTQNGISYAACAYIQHRLATHLSFSGELNMCFRGLHCLIAVMSLAISACTQTSSQYASTSSSSISSSPRPFFGGERHLQDSPVGALYQNSAFAHGYRHGYEQGFHAGDVDVHMGRTVQVVPKSKDGSRDYSAMFGSKLLFQEGYQAGLRSGYNDAILGLEFRASERIRSVASGLNPVLSPSRRSYFDEGFADGFKSSHSSGAPVERVTAEYVEQYCRTTISGLHGLEYCSGFSRGYMLGIADAPATGDKIASTTNSHP